MVKEINIIRRLGSKQNDIKYFKHLLPIDCKIIVEPFGGSFAVSKFFYKDIEKYKFHINDLDDELFYLYKKYKTYIDVRQDLAERFNNTEKLNKGKRFKDYIDNLDVNDYIKSYILDNILIKSYIVPTIPNNNYCKPEFDILDNSIFTNSDYKIILEQYKDNKDAFLFLDPPYLFSDNSGYYPQNENHDMTCIIPYILEFLKVSKCKVMLIINKLGILEYFFKDYIKEEYNKIYQI